MKQFTRIVALGAILSTPLALSVPAFADTADRAEVVKYADLDLSTPTGAEALYARLKVASWRVCRDTVSNGGLPGMIERSNCVTETLNLAVQDVNRPTLTALHQGKPALDLTASR